MTSDERIARVIFKLIDQTGRNEIHWQRELPQNGYAREEYWAEVQEKNFCLISLNPGGVYTATGKPIPADIVLELWDKNRSEREQQFNIRGFVLEMLLEAIQAQLPSKKYNTDAYLDKLLGVGA
ncbi:MAG: hypothetical protein ACRC46_03170 [Thermoguttaceae bacterium]